MTIRCLILGIWLAVAVSIAVPCQADWHWENPLPQGNGLYDVWWASPDLAFAVGAGGTVIRWDGNAAECIPSPGCNDLIGVGGTGPEDMYAIDTAGGIYRWDSRAWTEIAEPALGPIICAWIEDGNSILAAGEESVLYQWNGGSWTGIPTGTGEIIVCLWSWGTREVLAGTWEGRILRWNGAVWTPVWTGPSDSVIYAIWGRSPAEMYATSGVPPCVLRWDGAQWSEWDNPSVYYYSYLDVWGTADMLAIAGRGLYFHSSIGWTFGSPEENLHAIDGLPDGRWIAAGDAGLLAHGFGTVWEVVEHGPDFNGYAVWGDPDGHITATGVTDEAQPISLHGDRSEWRVELPAALGSRAVWGSGRSDVYGVGLSGLITHWDGVSWSQMASGTGETLNAVYGFSHDSVFAGGGAGTLLRYDGTYWQPMSSGTARPISDIWGTGPGGLYLGTPEEIRHWDGSQWEAVPLPCQGARASTGSPDGAIFVSCSHSVYQWHGTGWAETLANPAGVIQDIWASADNDAWAVSEAGIYHWDGTRWTHDGRFRLYGSALHIVGSAPGAVFITGSMGGILHWDGISPTPTPRPVPAVSSPGLYGLTAAISLLLLAAARRR